MLRSFTFISCCASLSIASISFGQSSPDVPRPIPLTRPEMKQMLEDVKARKPRIPLPELTEADRLKLAERAESYEARVRYHYLSGDEQWSQMRVNLPATSVNNATALSLPHGLVPRPQDPKMTLDNGFKVELFWIVSRANNCPYCIGHQESKLLGAGRSEDRIAALDGDWSEFTPAEQVAYAFAKKYTYQPHMMNDKDISGLKKFYTEEQIIEMMLSMAWNNSINRWKEAIGVPQNVEEGGYSRMASLGTSLAGSKPQPNNLPRGSYLTPTSPEFNDKITQVASFAASPKFGNSTAAPVCARPSLETPEHVKQELERCRTRVARLPLVDEETTRSLMTFMDPRDTTMPNWMRLLAHFPEEGVRRAKTVYDADHSVDLNPLLKAQFGWIIARNDRAWYALGESMNRLLEQRKTEDEIFALDGDWSEFTPRERALFQLAKSLSASPVMLTDSDVANAVKLAGPAEVVQAINLVTQRVALDRLTEAAGLPLE